MDLKDSIEKIVAMAVAGTEPTFIQPSVDGLTALALPPGYQVKEFDLQHLLPAPRRKQARVQVDNADSFILYWAQYSASESRIFANGAVGQLGFVAILDYHQPQGPAGWREHIVQYPLRHTVEWERWTSKEGASNRMDQETFAQFLEDNAIDIVGEGKDGFPTAATMLEVAREIEVRKDVHFNGSVRLSNGKTQLNYTEDVAAAAGKGQFSIPEQFKIRIQPFLGSAMEDVICNLRFRLHAQSGKVNFWYELVRPHKVIERAFQSVVQKIKNECGTEIFFGTAPVPTK